MFAAFKGYFYAAAAIAVMVFLWWAYSTVKEIGYEQAKAEYAQQLEDQKKRNQALRERHERELGKLRADAAQQESKLRKELYATIAKNKALAEWWFTVVHDCARAFVFDGVLPERCANPVLPEPGPVERDHPSG